MAGGGIGLYGSWSVLLIPSGLLKTGLSVALHHLGSKAAERAWLDSTFVLVRIWPEDGMLGHD